jgi:hypothetical protein
MGNLSLRREDCLRIGLGNPDYGTRADAYHVDRDFGLRCLEGGLLGVHDRSIRADHVMTRSLESFLATSAAQGAGVVGLHRMHPNVLGPMSRERFLEGLPRPLRALTHACRHQAVCRSMRVLLIEWIRLAGTFGLTSAQLPAARLARRIEQHRGALAALDRQRA